MQLPMAKVFSGLKYGHISRVCDESDVNPEPHELAQILLFYAQWPKDAAENP